jgi:sulfopyruvate decarboxylase TPP-binding subunit
MHAIVMNAVSGLTSSRLPAHILMSNRDILGGYAEARNQVTDIGRDMCKLHRLIQLQRRMVKSLDQVIESLEGESQ